MSQGCNFSKNIFEIYSPEGTPQKPMILHPKKEILERTQAPFSLSQDGSIVMLGEFDAPNIAEIFKHNDFSVVIHREMMNPITNLTVLDMASRYEHVVVVTPKVLVNNYQRKLYKVIGKDNIKVVSSTHDWDGVKAKVTVISEHIFSKIELSENELSKAVAVQEYYPNRCSPLTKTQTNITTKLHKFSKALVIVDSNAGMLSALRKDSKGVAPQKESLLEQYSNYIKLAFQLEGV